MSLFSLLQLLLFASIPGAFLMTANIHESVLDEIDGKNEQWRTILDTKEARDYRHYQYQPKLRQNS